MQPTGPRDASFSPYHDEDRLLDFLDDDAQRLSANAAVVFLIHLGLVLSLSGSFIVPDLKPPPPPEAVTVEIVTFDPQPEPEPEPAPVVIEPVLAPPPPAPVPKPQPEPQARPDPTPVPPPPQPEPEPEPEPEPVFTPPPPPPEIIAQPEPVEPDTFVLPEPEPFPEPEPEPQPIIEVFEPLPEPIVEPEPEPIIEIFEPEPLIEPEPLLEPEPLIIDPELPPTPGLIEAEPLPDFIEPEPLPPEIILEPLPELLPEPEPRPLPQIVAEPEPEFFLEPETILITPPTILASPDAPESREEEIRAVPQEQSDPFIDLIKRDRNSSLDEPIAAQPRGGGNEGPISQGGSVNAPPGGGTSIGRPSPGAGGWTLAPQGTATNKAYEGINLDIRCREEGRTHEDCPEYVKKFRGRNQAGRESFDGHAGTGTDRGDRISSSRRIPSRSELGLNLGDPSINSGGPSTNVLEFPDQNFDREFLSGKIVTEPPPPGLLGLSGAADSKKDAPDWVLKTPDANLPDADIETSESVDWILKKSPDE